MKKIAIVNRTNLKNYGSVLQVYALCEVVKNLGYDVEVIWETGNLSKNYDFRPNKIISTGCKLLTHPRLLKSTFSNIRYVQQHIISEQTIQMFDSFVDSRIKRTFYPAKMMKQCKVGRAYDKFICGSDQIWCTTTLYVDPLMYLRFAPKEKRVAYAPSLGRDYIPSYSKREMKKYIKDIPDVSVREYVGQKLIRELTGRDVPVVLDPTLLISCEEWDQIKKVHESKEEYIVCYFLNTPTEETQQKLLKFIKESRKIVIALNSRLEHVENEVTVLYPDCGPREFIGYISNAEYVLTDSYHGMLFSIIYHRQFWSIAREYGKFDQSSRQLSVLEMFGLNARYCRTQDIITEDTIDYETVQKRMDSEIEKSLNYLRRALEK